MFESILKSRGLFKKDSGFTLIEVLVAIAILAVASVGVIKLNQNNMQSVKTSAANIEINAVLNEVHTLLASPEVCKLNFLGLRANNSTNNITEIKNADGQVKLKNNTVIRQGIKISSMRLYDGGGGATDMYPDVNVNPNSDGDTYLELNFDKGKQTYAQNITRKVKIWVKTDNGRKIVECRSYGLGGSETMQRSTTNVDDIYYKDGNVGIGTDQPTSQLEVKGGFKLDEQGARPTCNNTQRGTFWFSKGGAGTADKVEVCSKKADGSYSWNSVQSSGESLENVRSYTCSPSSNSTCTLTSARNTKFCYPKEVHSGGSDRPTTICSVSGPDASGIWTLKGSAGYIRTEDSWRPTCFWVCIK